MALKRILKYTISNTFHKISHVKQRPLRNHPVVYSHPIKAHVAIQQKNSHPQLFRMRLQTWHRWPSLPVFHAIFSRRDHHKRNRDIWHVTKNKACTSKCRTYCLDGHGFVDVMHNNKNQLQRKLWGHKKVSTTEKSKEFCISIYFYAGTGRPSINREKYLCGLALASYIILLHIETRLLLEFLL